MSRLRSFLRVSSRSRSLTPTGRSSPSPGPPAGAARRRSSLHVPAPQHLLTASTATEDLVGGGHSYGRGRRGSDVSPVALLFRPSLRPSPPKWKRSVCATPTLLVTPGSPPDELPPPIASGNQARDAFCRSLTARTADTRWSVPEPQLLLSAAITPPTVSPNCITSPLPSLRRESHAGEDEVDEITTSRDCDPPQFVLGTPRPRTSPVFTEAPPRELCSLNSLKFDTPERAEVTENGLAGHPGAPVLGRGTFGIVVLGSHKGRPVAVKVLRSRQPPPGELLAARLRHPHILAVLGVHGRDAAYPTVEMEYCGQTTLQRLLELAGSPLPAASSARYIGQLTSALAYCHAENVMHLDVKPANVIVTTAGDLKLADFGSARSVGDLTARGNAVRGTVPYMAPELFCGEIATCKVDVYSLGVCTWQVLTRQTPFAGLEPEVVIYMVVARQRRPEAEVSISDDRWQAVVARCWTQRAEDRPSTAELERWMCALDNAGKWTREFF